MPIGDDLRYEDGVIKTNKDYKHFPQKLLAKFKSGLKLWQEIAAYIIIFCFLIEVVVTVICLFGQRPKFVFHLFVAIGMLACLYIVLNAYDIIALSMSLFEI